VTNRRRRRGRRSQAEAARTRERILDRAERLFARKGYGGVSLRAAARAAGVRPFTIQHHFGSKPGLYRAVLHRWDAEVLARLARVLAQRPDLPSAVEGVVDELFDFFLARRDWVAVTSHAALGDGPARRVPLLDRSWIDFMDEGLREHRSGLKLDLRLLLVTIEGILHHHVLSTAHYRQLFGKDVTDPRLRLRAKEHLNAVILALVGTGR
jgi:AcrR family transcriptional regulator